MIYHDHDIMIFGVPHGLDNWNRIETRVITVNMIIKGRNLPLRRFKSDAESEMRIKCEAFFLGQLFPRFSSLLSCFRQIIAHYFFILYYY